MENGLAQSLLKFALDKKEFQKPLLITFDGFDEVLDKSDREKVINLLKALKEKPNAKFWVTTRLQHQPQLENDLSTFAVTFEPLNKNKQRVFIKKFLKDRLSLVLDSNELNIFGKDDEVKDPLSLLNIEEFKNIFQDDNEVIRLLSSDNEKKLEEIFGDNDKVKDRLRSLNKNELVGVLGNHGDKERIGNIRMWQYTEAFIQKMQSVFKGDISGFIDTPLQLYLLLGGLQEAKNSEGHIVKKGCLPSFKDWVNSNDKPDFNYVGSNTLEVYKKFIDGKYETYFKKVGITQGTEQNEKKFIYNKYGKELAKVNREIGRSGSKSELLEEHKDMILSVGLIKSDGKDFSFTHPTFEEYFASAIYMHWIEKESNQRTDYSGRQKELIENVLINPDYSVIRSFINFRLARLEDKGQTLPEATLKQYGAVISKLWQQQPNPLIGQNEETILYISVKEKHEQIVKLLLDSLKASKEIRPLRQLVRSYDRQNGYTILHLAAQNKDTNILKQLLTSLKRHHKALKKLVLQKLYNGNVQFDYSLYSETALHLATQNDYVDGIKLILESVKDYPEIFKELLLARTNYGYSALHIAAENGYKDALELLLGAARAEYNPYYKSILVDTLKKLVLTVPFENPYTNVGTEETFLHLAAKNGHTNVVDQLFISLENYPGILEKLVSCKAYPDDSDDINYEGTALHLAAAKGLAEIVERLSDVATSNPTVSGDPGSTKPVQHSSNTAIYSAPLGIDAGPIRPATGPEKAVSDVIATPELYTQAIKTVPQQLATGEVETIPQLLCDKIVQQNVSKIAANSTQVDQLLAKVREELPNIQQQCLQQNSSLEAPPEVLGNTTTDVNLLRQSICSMTPIDQVTDSTPQMGNTYNANYALIQNSIDHGNRKCVGL
ncbi:ankyrin repeat domain-containing protein [Cardinium endosymbiont of Nabis limbatus]|uniref:ankyrin repeat domain-containing protein n=1 Tax=Cardinium endosymbiont of Nabis limbatus TaxID=3066217 RepID=UPI003AF402EF